MSLGHSLGKQLQCPQGLVGLCLGRAMTLVNERANKVTIAGLEVQPADHILELGFGPGRGIARLASLASSGKVSGIDRSPVMLRQASRRNARVIESGRVELRQGDFASLALADGSIDKVLGVNVVYFWSDAGQILGEIARVTKPNALIALYATHKNSMRNWSFAHTGSHRLYDEDDMKNLFRHAGFPAGIVEIELFPVGFGVRGIRAMARKGAPAEIDGTIPPVPGEVGA